VTLVHVVMALGNLAFVASGVPCHSDRVRNIFAYHEAILISQRYTHGPICEKLEQLARRVEVDRGQLVDAPQVASEGEVGDLVRRDRPGGSKVEHRRRVGTAE